VKAPQVTRTFETAGSPVAYLDAPEFSKFVADDSARPIAAVKKIGKVEQGTRLTFCCPITTFPRRIDWRIWQLALQNPIENLGRICSCGQSWLS
jgi:hypothetical protein